MTPSAVQDGCGRRPGPGRAAAVECAWIALGEGVDRVMDTLTPFDPKRPPRDFPAVSGGGPCRAAFRAFGRTRAVCSALSRAGAGLERRASTSRLPGMGSANAPHSAWPKRWISIMTFTDTFETRELPGTRPPTQLSMIRCGPPSEHGTKMQYTMDAADESGVPARSGREFRLRKGWRAPCRMDSGRHNTAGERTPGRINPLNATPIPRSQNGMMRCSPAGK